MSNLLVRDTDFLVPVSIGEVVDKITILRIKSGEIKDPTKLENVRNELAALEKAYLDYVGEIPDQVADLTAELQKINKQLWIIEDDIRDCERDRKFESEFIRLARAVYVTNDERARLKKEINIALGSTFVEEKSYKDYSAES